MSTPIRGPAYGSPEWDQMRIYNEQREPHVVFGASEAAACCGLSPYKTKLELYLEKRGEIEQPPIKEEMRLGLLLEPVVLEEYSQRTGHLLTNKGQAFFHPDFRFLAATPDGIATERATDEWLHCVDAKTSTWRRYKSDVDEAIELDVFGPEGTDTVPTDYVMQAQQQMLVTGLQRVDFPVLFDTRTLRVYTVHADRKLQQFLLDAVHEMYRRVTTGDPPEIDLEHKSALELVRKLYPVEIGLRVELDDSATEWWRFYREVSHELNKLELQKKEAMGRILTAMGRAQTAYLPSASGDIILRRQIVDDAYWTEDDVERARESVGQVKRRGYTRLVELKQRRKNRESRVDDSGAEV